MKTTFNQGIGIFENAFPEEWCDKVIEFFENNPQLQYSRSENAAIAQKDLSISVNAQHNPEIYSFFHSYFFKNIYPLYSYEFATLRKADFHSIDSFKIQKTLPTQGFHDWHCEDSELENANRIAVVSLYLNDVKEGGETEFLYQSLRTHPKKGTALIWPSGYYHTHRGNPPLSGVKYIITGWLEFIPEVIKKHKSHDNLSG